MAKIPRPEDRTYEIIEENINLKNQDAEFPIPMGALARSFPPVQIIVRSVPKTGINVALYRTINEESGYEADPDYRVKKLWKDGTYHFVIDANNISQSEQYFARKIVLSGRSGDVSFATLTGGEVGVPGDPAK